MSRQGRDPATDLVVDVDLGAVLQQQLHHVQEAAAGRPHQRRHVVLAGHVGVGAGLEQRPHRLRPVLVGGPE